MTATADSYLTVPEVAGIVRRKDATVRKWCSSGMLKASKVGRGWLIEHNSVDSLVSGGSNSRHQGSTRTLNRI